MINKNLKFKKSGKMKNNEKILEILIKKSGKI